jgi:hypothetical protein
MIGRLSLIVVAGVAAVALVSVIAASASTGATRLVGAIGPTCKISLKKGREEVLYLKPGSYRITVRDRSKKLGFAFGGPGAWGRNTRITSHRFVGTKTVAANLKPGLVVYYSPFPFRGNYEGCRVSKSFRVE